MENCKWSGSVSHSVESSSVTPWTVACQAPVHGSLQTRILKIPFSRESSQPRDGTWVSCTIDRFFIIWAPREAWEWLCDPYFFQCFSPLFLSSLCEGKRKRAFVLIYGHYRRRQWHPTPGFLPGKSHGRRSLVGCSPWGLYVSDKTERLHFHFSLSRIGEGNGNPLQGSCLETPRDEGAWWAAVYGAAQSRTRLKQFSSSSSSCVLIC